MLTVRVCVVFIVLSFRGSFGRTSKIRAVTAPPSGRRGGLSMTRSLANRNFNGTVELTADGLSLFSSSLHLNIHVVRVLKRGLGGAGPLSPATKHHLLWYDSVMFGEKKKTNYVRTPAARLKFRKMIKSRLCKPVSSFFQLLLFPQYGCIYLAVRRTTVTRTP